MAQTPLAASLIDDSPRVDHRLAQDLRELRGGHVLHRAHQQRPIRLLDALEQSLIRCERIERHLPEARLVPRVDIDAGTRHHLVQLLGETHVPPPRLMRDGHVRPRLLGRRWLLRSSRPVTWIHVRVCRLVIKAAAPCLGICACRPERGAGSEARRLALSCIRWCAAPNPPHELEAHPLERRLNGGAASLHCDPGARHLPTEPSRSSRESHRDLLGRGDQGVASRQHVTAEVPIQRCRKRRVDAAQHRPVIVTRPRVLELPELCLPHAALRCSRHLATSVATVEEGLVRGCRGTPLTDAAGPRTCTVHPLRGKGLGDRCRGDLPPDAAGPRTRTAHPPLVPSVSPFELDTLLWRRAARPSEQVGHHPTRPRRVLLEIIVSDHLHPKRRLQVAHARLSEHELGINRRDGLGHALIGHVALVEPQGS